MKSCPKLTRDFNDPEKMDRLRAHIQYQQPTVNLYQFVGTLTVYSTRVAPEDSSELLASSDTDGGVASLGLDNLLLRGARLKDTDFVYGMHITFNQQLVKYILKQIGNVRMRRLYWTGYKTRSQLVADQQQVLHR